MTFRKNNSGSIEMVNTGVMLVVLLVVLYIGVNIIDNVEDATSLDAGSAATGVWTTGAANVTIGEYTNITAGGVTYAFYFNNTTSPIAPSGYILVDVSGGWNTSALVHTNLTAAINGNATLAALITAVNTTAATNTTTITADARGVAANSYGTVDGSATGAWGAATMSGGVDDDTFYSTETDLIATTDASYAMAGIMPIVMIAVAVLGGLLGILYLFRGRD
jgi:hypothetical protein